MRYPLLRLYAELGTVKHIDRFDAIKHYGIGDSRMRAAILRVLVCRGGIPPSKAGSAPADLPAQATHAIQKPVVARL